MKAKKVTGFKCSSCDNLYESEDEAIDCCMEEKREETEAWKCSECEEIYEDKESAKECCK